MNTYEIYLSLEKLKSSMDAYLTRINDVLDDTPKDLIDQELLELREIIYVWKSDADCIIDEVLYKHE